MTPVYLAFISILGLVVGSFLNMNIDRIPRGESILFHSRCDYCQHRLSAYDLVPLLSYLLLRGRCRYCGHRITRRAFLVEVVTGVLFGLAAYQFGLTALTGVVIVYGSLFIAISVIDLEQTIIPDVLVIPGLVLAFAIAPVGFVGEDRSLGDTYLRVLEGLGLGLGIMLLIYLVALLVYRAAVGFGFGDVKLGALIGAVTGFPEVLIPLYFAFIAGGLVAILLLLLKLRGRRDVIPYGPFLTSGAILTLMVGKELGWYTDRFF